MVSERMTDDCFSSDGPCTYVGAGPFMTHVYIADGKRGYSKPTSIVVHYGEEELEVRPERIWDVLKELFGEQGKEED